MDNSTQIESNITSEVAQLASSFLAYKIGYYINKYYFPVFIPLGIIGNILSFLVMVQVHNRQSPLSLYLASLAVSDTMLLSAAYVTYLSMEHHVRFPPDLFRYCVVLVTFIFAAVQFSSQIVLSMTFDRFYGIIMPHKAASFNTLKRAKLKVTGTVIFSVVINIPHIFITNNQGWECVPFATAMAKPYGQAYYWLTLVIQFAFPFVSLLAMNSVIIHKIRKRSFLSDNNGKQNSSKNSESQIFAILLLVTFAFLILNTPAYSFFLSVMVVDFFSTPKRFAGYYLFYNVAHKLQLTNHGINFLLYVLSGEKFRTDVTKLFKMKKKLDQNSNLNSTGTILTVS